MSQNQPPKKFLKKGEGLKRFAAYKPPLPIRRRTFVKFKIDKPDLLDEPNLSTQVPKIAPPKIMHTPIKPRKPPSDAPKRYNLRGSRKQQNLEDINKNETKRTRRQIKAVVERHIETTETPDDESQIKGDLDNLLRKIEEKKTILDEERISEEDYNIKDDTPITREPEQRLTKSPSFDLSNPMPGSCILALGQQIQQIQSTVDELKDKVKKCECGLMSGTKPPTVKPTTRNASRTKANDRTRPSAYADNSTPKIMRILMDEVNQLKTRFDDINLRR